MTPRGKHWLVVGASLFLVVAGGLFIAAFILAGRVEPYVREQAIQYLRERFDSDVELGRLQVHVPPDLPLLLLFHAGRGALAQVEGTDLSLACTAETTHRPFSRSSTLILKSILGRYSIHPRP